MNKPPEHKVDKAVDSIQQRLTHYACTLNYEGLTPDAIHAAKVRVIDTLGALVGGFFSEPARIGRDLAAQMPDPGGATVIGTRWSTTLDMAAFANAIAARYLEMNDNYQAPGSFGGHPSDVITPLLGVAEYARSSGRELIASIVLAYEIFTRVSDVFHNMGFDSSNFATLATAAAAGKLLKLSPDQLAHCISMAVVPNNMLRQVRTGHMSMFKAGASGQAARAGIFAALLAREGMEGPHLPFEGKAGWCDHVARERFSLDVMGGNGTPFKIPDASIKLRPASGLSISSIVAAEKVAPVKNQNVKQIIVEVSAKSKERAGEGEQRWNPDARETADHSIPYVVAATLMDGVLTPHSFNDAHLWDPELRALMKKIDVVANAEFTQAFERLPQEHRARITIVTTGGERLVGESGGEKDDLAAPKSDAQIEEKFRSLTEDFLGAKRVQTIVERLWRLEDLDDVAVIAPDFVLA